MVAIARSVPVVGNAGLLFVKVAALLLMVVDHVDWFLFAGSLGLNGTVGRVVAPAFAVVLALNLHRIPVGGEVKLLWRMVLVGALAHLPYLVLQGHVLPLNIMFTLALAVAAIGLVRRGAGLYALLLVGALGSGVDYAWLGVGAVLVAYWLLGRGHSIFTAGAAAAGVLAVWNGSLWSFGVLGLLAAAAVLRGDAPRWKWAFYVAYPAHLLVIAGVLYLG